MSVFSIYSDSVEGYFTIYDSEHPEDCTILSPHIQMSTNKAAGLDFTVLPGNEGYDSFHELSTFVYLYRDNKCIFRGRVSDVKTDIYKQRNVTCDGDLAILSDSIQAPNTFVDILTVGNTKKKQKKKRYKDDNVTMTAEQYFRSVIESHNFQMPDGRKQFTVGTVSASGRNKTDTFSLTSYNDTSSIISSTILSKFGGIIRTRYVNDVAYIDWIESYSENNSQDVRFGVNLIEFDEDQPDDDIWTVLLPIGNNGVTIESVNNGNKFLENANAIQKYGRIVHYHKFDTKKAEDLLYKAQVYMGIYCKVYPKDIRVKAVDLELLGSSNDPLELGDLIRVVSSPHGIDRRLACIEMDMDIFNPENNTYTIGSIMPPDEKEKTTLSSKSSSSKKAIKQASSYMSDGFDSFNQDLDTLGNNVNVNAENIAINAQNIAVNAENIAVVAKNISVVADTIDVKARELTATFEDEIGDLQTVIQVTKEGIVATMTDNVQDLKGTISATAEALTVGYEQKIHDESGNITAAYTSLVQQTAQGITSSFDATLYGEGGTAEDPTGGIVADYKARINDTAQGLTREYTALLYGEGGTAEDPTGGIVSEYNSKLETTGQALTSDYEQKIRDESGNITAAYTSLVQQTAQSLTASFNTKLYGEGGTEDDPTGGIVSEYNSKLEVTSQNLTSAYEEKIRDESGKITAAYTSSIQQTAQNLTVNFNTKLYGEGGTEDDPTGGIVSEYDSKLEITSQNLTSAYEEKIRDESGNITEAYTSLVQQSARSLTSDFSEKLYGEGGTEDNPTGGIVSEYRSSFTQTAQEISSKVSMTDFNGNEIASRINQNATTILIQAQHINLDGYVTASELSTTNANITNLMNGNTTASAIHANSMDVYNSFYIGSAQNSASFYVNGTQYAGARGITFMGTTKRYLVNLSDYGTAVNWDLSHSHSVSVGADGTVTLGEAVATNASNRSFRIADTKTYKDGVSAAAANVTVNAINERRDRLYDSSTHGTTVFLQAVASNGATKDSDITISGTQAYNAGKTAGQTEGAASVVINAINERRDRLYNSSTYGTTVFLQAVASNGATKDSDITVSGTQAYNAGKTDGAASVTVGKPVERMDRVYSSSTHNTTIYIKAEASNGAYNTGDFTINGSDAYNAGKTDGAASVTVSSIVRTATATYSASTGNYTIPVKATASNNAYKESSLTISGSDAYNAGWGDVTITSLGRDTTKEATYDASANKYTIPFGAEASNGAKRTMDFRLTATGAYNNGKTAGQAEGAASVTVGKPVERMDRVYSSSTHDTTIYIKAEASNGEYNTGDFTISGTNAYNAGSNSVTISSVGKNSSGNSYYNTSTNKYTIALIATASNGKTRTADYTFTATGAYNNGYEDGHDAGYDEGFDDGYSIGSSEAEQDLPADDVTFEDVEVLTSTWSSRYTNYTVNLRVKLSNGRYFPAQITVDATKAYNTGNNAGYDAGVSDGKTAVLNNFTVNDVYVYRVQNAYRADVRVHYGSNDYTRGNLTCVRGI